jgi:hypothetical protein
VAAAVVAAVRASGACVSVGCSAGADALVLAAALGAGSPVRVSAVGSLAGAGFWSGSAPLALLRAAPSVAWLAGGALAVPLRARLLRRSLAALAGASAAVFLAPGPGSLAVAGAAVSAGVPVFAVVAAGSAAPAAPRGAVGSWAPGAFPGLVLPAGYALLAWSSSAAAAAAAPAQLALF